MLKRLRAKIIFVDRKFKSCETLKQSTCSETLTKRHHCTHNNGYKNLYFFGAIVNCCWKWGHFLMRAWDVEVVVRFAERHFTNMT